MEHILKTWPKYFGPIGRGEKTFEIRKDDRGFAVGDVLVLKEYFPETDDYSGREVRRRVTYITNFKQLPGYVVMAIQSI